jgi:hypothetical protein
MTTNEYPSVYPDITEYASVDLEKTLDLFVYQIATDNIKIRDRVFRKPLNLRDFNIHGRLYRVVNKCLSFANMRELVNTVLCKEHKAAQIVTTYLESYFSDNLKDLSLTIWQKKRARKALVETFGAEPNSDVLTKLDTVTIFPSRYYYECSTKLQIIFLKPVKGNQWATCVVSAYPTTCLCYTVSNNKVIIRERGCDPPQYSNTGEIYATLLKTSAGPVFSCWK